MSNFKQHDLVKAKGSEIYMSVESVNAAADATEMVTCRWEDMWRNIQHGTFRADHLEPVPDPGRRSTRRRRR
jgi:hypothetical protein